MYAVIYVCDDQESQSTAYRTKGHAQQRMLRRNQIFNPLNQVDGFNLHSTIQPHHPPWQTQTHLQQS